MFYNDLCDKLRNIDKSVLLLIIHDLMIDGKLSFADLAKVHNDYLEELRTKQNEEYDNLRVKVLEMWCDTKKNYDKNLKGIMHYLVDLGQVNLDHKRIDKK